MSIASVITGGFGVPGSASLVITDGYAVGVPVVPPVVTVTGVAHGGGGVRYERWQQKRPSLADVVDLAVRDVIAELRKADEPQVRERAEAIVAPHVVKPRRARPRIDYDALERDIAAVRALARLLVEQRQREYDEDEEEEAMIYAAL